jgi:DNA ligase 1
MKRFANLLDRLAYEPRRNAKLRLMTEYFRGVPDPERGYTLAALTGSLTFAHAKPGMIRALVIERVDAALFAMSFDYVGDLSETVALIWPRAGAQTAPGESRPAGPTGLPGMAAPLRTGRGIGAQVASSGGTDPSSTPSAERTGVGSAQEDAQLQEAFSAAPTLTEVVTKLASLSKADLPAQLTCWLDGLDETGRWALLKLLTGELRIGVSARLAKTAVAALGAIEPNEIELIWPGLAPPYIELFAFLEGRGEKPSLGDPAPFRPVMLAHAVEPEDFAALDPSDFTAEWKWDGIRVQAVSARGEDGRFTARLYSRTGEDLSKGFPDLVPALRCDAALDGELLIVREGLVQSFNMLQQRLNRKSVTAKLLADFPAHLRAYDLLVADGEDLRDRPFLERRARLESLLSELNDPRITPSALVAFKTWEELGSARADPAAFGAGPDAAAVEGVMLKRRQSPYVPGRPRGLWWKWKRGPLLVDAVLMYAQRGHGRRSSYYSDYTFGVWRDGPAGEELAPVGKAYFGFTDQELVDIDRFVRRNTTSRFGPVREVVHERDHGLVLEVAFEGLQRSSRHKSGVAMRFPRINRLRWDKPPGAADRLETLERLLEQTERTRDSAHRLGEAVHHEPRLGTHEQP